MVEQRSNMLALQPGPQLMNVRLGALNCLLIFTMAKFLTVKLIASFLLSYPLAGVLKRIPDAKPSQKNSFIIA